MGIASFDYKQHLSFTLFKNCHLLVSDDPDILKFEWSLQLAHMLLQYTPPVREPSEVKAALFEFKLHQDTFLNLKSTETKVILIKCKNTLQFPSTASLLCSYIGVSATFQLTSLSFIFHFISPEVDH